MSKYHTLDYEYNRENNEFLHLVCVSLDGKGYWLNDGSDLEQFKSDMESIKGDFILAHAASLAEIPCTIKLGINVDEYTWIDTESLFKFINHLEQGTIGNERKTSLVECLNYFGLGKNFTSTEEKNSWRDVILNNNVELFKEGILKYCASDTSELLELFYKEKEYLNDLINSSKKYDNLTCMKTELNTKKFKTFNYDDKERIFLRECKNYYTNFDFDKFIESESLNHISVAKMYSESYNADKYIIEHLQDPRFENRIKELANELIPGLYNEKGTRKDDVLQEWIFKNIEGSKEWWDKGFHKDGEIKSKTEKGSYSFADKVLDYFCEEFNNNENIEKFRVLKKLLQTTQGLSRSKDDKKGWYYPNLYSDGLHCHANEHGANTTRFGNKSSAGHIPSWGKALRSALKPTNTNEVYFSLDFNAQEMWIIGQLSKDINLLEVYSAQDVYMKMAQDMNLYPKNLPIPTEEQRKEDWFKPYKQIRKNIKGVNLGMNYGMSYNTYAIRNQIDIKTAKGYWDKFEKLFSSKTNWGKILQYYFSFGKVYGESSKKVECYDKGLLLMTGKEQIITRFRETNNRFNSSKQLRGILNFPVQCMGAQITRRAIRYTQSKGLHPFLPVHDEIYFKTTTENLDRDIEIATECMKQAAIDCMDKPILKYPIKVGSAELYTSDKYTIHEGAEERFNQIMEICKWLDEVDNG